jgi:hypothetical protein
MAFIIVLYYGIEADHKRCDAQRFLFLANFRAREIAYPTTHSAWSERGGPMYQRNHSPAEADSGVGGISGAVFDGSVVTPQQTRGIELRLLRF